MSAVAQRSLLDATPDEAPRPRPARAAAARASAGRRPPGRQLRLVLAPRVEPAAPLDPRGLAHAAARLVAGPEPGLVEMRLLGLRAVPPAEAADPTGARLLVAPCAASGAAVAAFHGRAVVAGRGARSERVAGRARLEGPWLVLEPLAEDAPSVRMPLADARVWGEVVLVARSGAESSSLSAARGSERRSG